MGICWHIQRNQTWLGIKVNNHTLDHEDMIITGQRIRAKRAHEIGLVWELTAKGEGLGRAFRVAAWTGDVARSATAVLARLAGAYYGSTRLGSLAREHGWAGLGSA